MSTRLVLSIMVVLAVVGLSVVARSDAPVGRYAVASGTVYDNKTKLTWQQSVLSTTHTWSEAKTYCDGLNLAGTGWRLPTAKELQTLVDETRTNPAIDPNAFPSTAANAFWSSSPAADSFSNAYYVHFFIGRTTLAFIATTNLVRCVR